jgi:two-component sensor histidine kinase
MHQMLQNDPAIPVALSTAIADARHRRWSLGLCLVISGITLALLPWAAVMLRPIPSTLSFYIAVVICTDAITVHIIFGQFRQDRSKSLAVLGGVYLFTTGMALAHMVTFPTPTGEMWGGLNSSPWLWMAWHYGYPAAILLFLLTEWRGRGGERVAVEDTPRVIAKITAVTFALVLGLAGVAIYGHDYLPELLLRPTGWTPFNGVMIRLAAVLTLVTLVIHCWITRCRSFLHLWLAVALVAFLCDIVPNMLSHGRYTVGWYLGRLNAIVASSFLMLMFLAETNRLYQRLGIVSWGLAAANQHLEQQIGELQDTNAHLHRIVAEKNLLLREVYHRVKNNLQVVDTLLILHTDGLPPEAQHRVEDLRKRVNALGLVHQQLMQSSDLATLDIGRFLTDLCQTLATSMDAGRRGITLKIDAIPGAIDLELAIPLGLLVTELVSNAFKHAFPDGRSGEVAVTFCCEGPARGRLRVSDNGCGMPDQPNTTSVGQTIIEALLGQMDATMTAYSNGGTHIDIVLPLPEHTAC